MTNFSRPAGLSCLLLVLWVAEHALAEEIQEFRFQIRRFITLFGRRMVGWMDDSSWLLVSCDVAGGSPGAGYFLLLRQKKVTKEKATQVRRPFGVPVATER